MASTAPIAKFGAISTPTSVRSASWPRSAVSDSSVQPVVPTTAWMPWSTNQRTLSAVTEGTVRSIATSACASLMAERSSPRPMRATSSRSGASPTARQAAAPIRPEAPSTATRVGRCEDEAGDGEAVIGVLSWVRGSAATNGRWGTNRRRVGPQLSGPTSTRVLKESENRAARARTSSTPTRPIRSSVSSTPV